MLAIHPEIIQALAENRAIVALESTVIAHGLPYPENITVAKEMEAIVRQHQAVPATIAIFAGQIQVGLNSQQLERLGKERFAKISRRDISLIVAEGGNGATTVASSIWSAHRAGIEVFATGGIGGVHPGNLGDVSADLPTLATTPIAVVCSGAKSILDVPRTREWLETWGIPVLGYRSATFPAFYSGATTIAVDRNVADITIAASYVCAHLRLNDGAILLTAPVPTASEVTAEAVAALQLQAEQQAVEQGIHGAALTPFLLAYLQKASAGATLQANVALLKNNAALAAQLAVAIKNQADNEKAKP